MTLREKIAEIILVPFHNQGFYIDLDKVEKYEQIADEFAIGFAEWKEAIRQDENGMYFSESRIQVSRKNPIDIKQLLQIYKKEKGL